VFRTPSHLRLRVWTTPAPESWRELRIRALCCTAPTRRRSLAMSLPLASQGARVRLRRLFSVINLSDSAGTECRVCALDPRRVAPSPPGLAQGDHRFGPGSPRSGPRGATTCAPRARSGTARPSDEWLDGVSDGALHASRKRLRCETRPNPLTLGSGVAASDARISSPAGARSGRLGERTRRPNGTHGLADEPSPTDAKAPDLDRWPFWFGLRDAIHREMLRRRASPRDRAHD
jgi:hypothetical protein